MHGNTLATLSSLLLATQLCNAGPTLTFPRVVDCMNTAVTLTVKQHRWAISNLIAFNTRGYEYGGVMYAPGPTIRMRPGTSCSITVINGLSTASPVSNCEYHANKFHCPDTTNLHTHGLHVSPDEDLIKVSIKPGGKWTYKYTLPSTHLMGTHWYHAHHHGATALQVMGGLAGALLVEPPSTYSLPIDLRALYLTHGHRVLVFQHINFNGADQGTSAAFAMKDYLTVSQLYKSANEKYESIPPNPTYLSSTSPRDFYVVNGQYQPTMEVKAGQVTLMRFVHAAGLRTVELVPSACSMRLLARDGVFHYTPYTTISSIVLVPGSRADVAILCPTSTVNTVVNIKSTPVAANSALSTENRHTQATVMALKVVATTTPTAILNNFPTLQAPLPSYLTTLMGSGTALSTGSKGVTKITLSLTGTGNNTVETVNGVSFPGFSVPESSRYVESMCLGKVYQFTIVPPGPPGGAARRRRQFPPPPGGMGPPPPGVAPPPGGAPPSSPGGVPSNPTGPAPSGGIPSNPTSLPPPSSGGVPTNPTGLPPPPSGGVPTNPTGFGPPPGASGLAPTGAPAAPAGNLGGGATGGAPATGAHPYHQHVYHFQIASIAGLSSTTYADVIRIGEWRDTAPAFAPNGITIRFKPQTFTGEIVMHCHILQHEDQGMMGLYQVKNC